jgi:hypothetical protein
MRGSLYGAVDEDSLPFVLLPRETKLCRGATLNAEQLVTTSNESNVHFIMVSLSLSLSLKDPNAVPIKTGSKVEEFWLGNSEAAAVVLSFLLVRASFFEK